MTGQMLSGKVAVITGAGRGLGKASAKVCLREGAKILAVDFSGDEEKTAAELGPGVVPFHADVSKEDQVEAAFAAALKAFGRVDASLHSAATLGGKPKGEVTLEEYERMTNTNFLGILLCCKHAVRAMLRSGGGSIVNFSSVGSLSVEDMAPITYSAAKAAVNSLTKAYAVEFGAKGIRANVLAPGFSYTEIMESMPSETFRYMSEKAALRRAGTPQEQAEVAAFLASDRSSFVTGAIIPVDGGWSVRMA